MLLLAFVLDSAAESSLEQTASVPWEKREAVSASLQRVHAHMAPSAQPCCAVDSLGPPPPVWGTGGQQVQDADLIPQLYTSLQAVYKLTHQWLSSVAPALG